MDIVLGLDAAAPDDAAIERVIDRAQDDEVLVAVYGGDVDARESAGGRVRERLLEAGLDPSTRLLGTDPGARLVELAETDGYDCIVLGGSQSPLGKVRLDAVAEFVVLNARTSVTLVR